MFSTLLPRIVLFRKEAFLLWKALLARETPLYLKAATLFAAFYLINPFDIIPDVVPFFGVIDDLILVPLLVMAVGFTVLFFALHLTAMRTEILLP